MDKSVSLRPSVRFTPKQQPTHKKEDFFFSSFLPTSTPKEPLEDNNDAYQEWEEWEQWQAEQELLNDTQKRTVKQKPRRKESICKFRDHDDEEDVKSDNEERPQQTNMTGFMNAQNQRTPTPSKE